jgi:hypothetical protein
MARPRRLASRDYPSMGAWAQGFDLSRVSRHAPSIRIVVAEDRAYAGPPVGEGFIGADVAHFEVAEHELRDVGKGGSSVVGDAETLHRRRSSHPHPNHGRICQRPIMAENICGGDLWLFA